MIKPKLLISRNTGALCAFRGFNAVAWRFGGQVKVCQVKHVWGPFYRRLGGDFFEDLNRFYIPEGVR